MTDREMIEALLAGKTLESESGDSECFMSGEIVYKRYFPGDQKCIAGVPWSGAGWRIKEPVKVCDCHDCVNLKAEIEDLKHTIEGMKIGMRILAIPCECETEDD